MVKIKRIIFWIITILSFILVALYLTSFSLGFRYNPNTHKWQKTGSFLIRCDPQDVKIYLNGRLLSTRCPKIERFLLPGNYDLKITKNGYYTWQKNIEVESGKVTRAENILLFLANIILSLSDETINYPTTTPPALALLPPSYNAKHLTFGYKDIIYQNGTIFYSDNAELRGRDLKGEKDFLITRFSKPINKFTLTKDTNHFFVVVEDKIIVCDKDGSNVIELITLPQKEYSKINITLDNQEDKLFLELDGKNYFAQIH